MKNYAVTNNPVLAMAASLLLLPTLINLLLGGLNKRGFSSYLFASDSAQVC